MKHTLRAVLVDDEELARGYLRELLATHPEIVVAAECANGFEAVKAIAETIPDLLFLDVQMPKLDGFEVLELIEPSQAPVVIFVTAYDQYAMRAFDAHAVDYLLKPFSAQRFERELERALARLGERRVLPEIAPEVRPSGERPQRMVVKAGTRIEPYGKESRIAILTDGTRLPVSRSGYARLLEAMGDSQGNRNSTR